MNTDGVKPARRRRRRPKRDATPLERGGLVISLAGVLLLVLIGILVLKVAWPTSVKPDGKITPTSISSVQQRPVAAVRGAIFDATGQVLASDVTVESLYVDPLRVTNPEQIASTLSTILGVSEQEIRRQLSGRQREQMMLETNLNPEQATAIRNLGRPELIVRSERRRAYPEGKLASQVLGATGGNGRGIIGLEASFDAELSGRIRTSEGSRGGDLVLTLNRYAQWVAETELGKAVAASKADGGTVVVMAPSTGAILAMAAWPPADFRQQIDEGQAKQFWHPAVASPFEPGTLLALFTVATAITSGDIAPDHVYLKRPLAQSVQNAGLVQALTTTSPEVQTPENMTQVVQRGSVNGIVYLVEKIGIDKFYQGMQAMGFGQPTGAGLPEENAGQVGGSGAANWRGLGVDFTVTSMQLAAAVSAIANNGVLMQPYLVQETHYGQELVVRNPRIVRQALSPGAAKAIREMMTATVQGPEPTVPQAAVPNYPTAGVASSPTPMIPSADAVVFAGFVPVEQPQLTILVKIERPRNSLYGAEVAAPVFRTIAEQLLAFYRVPPPQALIESRQ